MQNASALLAPFGKRFSGATVVQPCSSLRQEPQEFRLKAYFEGLAGRLLPEKSAQIPRGRPGWRADSGGEDRDVRLCWSHEGLR